MRKENRENFGPVVALTGKGKGNGFGGGSAWNFDEGVNPGLFYKPEAVDVFLKT